jgi:hypothetical protein
LDNTGSVTAFAQVKTASPADADSAPNNNATNVPVEDDEAAVVMTQGSGNTPRITQRGRQLIPIVINNLFPNPSEGELNVVIHANYKGEATFEWYNPQSGIVLTHKMEVNQGENHLFFDLTGLANGVYYLQTTMNAIKNMPIKYLKF